MRRAWVLVAGFVTLPFLILLWAHLAAVSTIERLEREMAEEVARQRAAGHPRPTIFGEPLPGNALDHYRRAAARVPLTVGQLKVFYEVYGADPLKELPASDLADLRALARSCAEDVNLGLRSAAFHRDRDDEAGMRRFHVDAIHEAWDPLVAGAEAERRAGDAATALRLLTAALGLYGDASRGVETYHLTTLPALDLPFRFWQRILEGPPLPAAELERALRALERIEAALPTAFDALRRQHELERIDLVLAYRGRQSNWASATELSWRHAGSRALLTCELLRALERQKADLDELARLPPRERVAAGRAHDREYFDGPQIGEGRLWMGIQDSLWRDVLIRLQLRLMRAATALAWHEADTGRLPAALEELVPRRLPEIPLCPMSGAPFRYADGRLWAFGFDRDDDGGRPVLEDNHEGDGDVVLRLRRN